MGKGSFLLCMLLLAAMLWGIWVLRQMKGESEYIAVPAPAEAPPLEILQYIDVHEDEGRTWFSVHPGPDASGEYYVLIEPFFIVETQLLGADGPVKLLRAPEVIVRSHFGIAVGSDTVPYAKKDLWKIRANVLLDKNLHYEFEQPGWEDFDPATDLN